MPRSPMKCLSPARASQAMSQAARHTRRTTAARSHNVSSARAEPQEYQQAPQEQRQQPQQQYGGTAPDIDEDPIGYFQHQNNETRQFLQQRHQYDQEKALWEHIDKSENHYRGELAEGEYDQAIDALKAHRAAEIYQQFPDTRENQMLALRSGFQSPAHMRQAQLQKDALDVAMHAARNGQTPAEAYYTLALQRGVHKPRAIMTKSYARNVMRHIDTVPDRDDHTFDEWFDKQYAPLAKSREGQR